MADGCSGSLPIKSPYQSPLAPLQAKFLVVLFFQLLTKTYFIYVRHEDGHDAPNSPEDVAGAGVENGNFSEN